MISFHPSAHPSDERLVATAFSSKMFPNPMVKLSSESCAQALSLTLGMFEFTPKSATSVGFTPPCTPRFPEWIIHTSPELAEHALDLVAMLRWARRYAQAQPNKVLARINKLYTILGDSQPQLLPTFLEEVARIFAHEGRIDDAQELFAKARKAERVYALSIAPARHAAVFAEFAASGLISATTFTQEARDVATRLSPQNAYTYSGLISKA